MKKGVLFSTLFLCLIFILSFVAAQDDNETTAALTVDDKAYECLEDKVGDCSAISSLDDKIFSLLAVNKCTNQVLAESQNNGECWPVTTCTLKSTAQAVLAMENANQDTSAAEDWLLSQNGTASELVWYLQIESSNPVSCTVSYSGAVAAVSTQVSFGADKAIDSIGGGNCFQSSVGDYWMKINPSCYNKEFQVSCNESFLTTLLYQKNQAGSPIYVSGATSSASANGGTVEKADASCFKRGVVCDYEGTLWAALALDALGYDITSHLPYLITLKEDHPNNLPDSFLWHLTGDTSFYNDLINEQTTFGGDSYWQKSSQGKFYDTALVLYSLQYDESIEKTNTIQWLADVQDEDGCWNHGNIRDTGFLLYSVWPRTTYGAPEDGGDGYVDCELSGFSCVSSYSCVMEAAGDILDGYDCGAGFVCCSTEIIFDTCLEQGGEICDETETCTEGESVAAADTGPGQECCVSGVCAISTTTEYTCGASGGTCRMYGCDDNEQESFSDTCEYDDACCIADSGLGGTTETPSLTWVWILVVLIILVVIGIVFKDKLRRIFFRAKSGAGRGRGRPGPGYPPTPPLTGHPERMASPRGPPPRMPPRRRPGRGGDMDDVLKKLKDMGR